MKNARRWHCPSSGANGKANVLWEPVLSDQPDMSIVLDHLLSKACGPALFASCSDLALPRLRVFAEGGAAALFARRTHIARTIRDAPFDTLHQSPSNFGINRTT